MTRADRTAQRLSKHLSAVLELVALTAAAAAIGDLKLAAARSKEALEAAARLAEALAAVKDRGYWAARPNRGNPARRGRKRAA